VYGPTTAATEEEMERFYQDLSQAVKQVPKRDILLVMGDFNAKVGNIICGWAVWLRGNELEDFCLEHKFKQHPRRLCIWTSPNGNTRNQIDNISVAQRWKKA